MSTNNEPAREEALDRLVQALEPVVYEDVIAFEQATRLIEAIDDEVCAQVLFVAPSPPRPATRRRRPPG